MRSLSEDGHAANGDAEAAIGKRKKSEAENGKKKDKKEKRVVVEEEEEEAEEEEKPKKKVKAQPAEEPEQKVVKKWVPGQAIKNLNNPANPMQKSKLVFTRKPDEQSGPEVLARLRRFCR